MDNIESFQIVMARKPLHGTVADNVTTWGVGGINVDGCRVGTEGGTRWTSQGDKGDSGQFGGGVKDGGIESIPSGRWPANVILDSIAGAALDAQSGWSRSSASTNRNGNNVQGITGMIAPRFINMLQGHSDSGGASRFFYNSDTVDPIIERTNMDFQLLHGDNREQLKHLADNSIDSIVCDPPYELGFMGKRWDSTGIAYDLTVWSECLRVLKPGGHLIAFGGTRTYHRMTVAIEDAGFEIRDCIMWLYGSGFPKSHDVSKALDKQAGAEREVITEKRSDMFGEYEVDVSYQVPDASKVNPHFISADTKRNQTNDYNKSYSPTAPATDLAKQWHGWGTALKPAVEPAVLARKPLIGTVADNVTTWGVGGLNIDGCRVGDGGQLKWSAPRGMGFSGGRYAEDFEATKNPSGRWPANVILDESAGEALDEQSGWSTSKQSNRGLQHSGRHGGLADIGANIKEGTDSIRGHSDSGGASRFFYTAKASKAEREAGLEGMEIKLAGGMKASQDGSLGGEPVYRANHHPTVKPIALMRYLVRIVTPKDGTVLDPFMGSGSTGCAAMCEGVNFVGIELSEEYLTIARRRIEYWQSQNPMGL